MPGVPSHRERRSRRPRARSDHRRPSSSPPGYRPGVDKPDGTNAVLSRSAPRKVPCAGRIPESPAVAPASAEALRGSRTTALPAHATPKAGPSRSLGRISLPRLGPAPDGLVGLEPRPAPGCAKDGQPISAGGTQGPVGGEPRHFLRRTDTSPLSARARHVYVMQQMGHTDPKPALRIYAKVISEQRRRAPARAW